MMLKKLKVVCINTDNHYNDPYISELQYHKTYDVIESPGSEDFYSVNVNNSYHTFLKSRFIPLSEYRENKLNQLFEK